MEMWYYVTEDCMDFLRGLSSISTGQQKLTHFYFFFFFKTEYLLHQKKICKVTSAHGIYYAGRKTCQLLCFFWSCL